MRREFINYEEALKQDLMNQNIILVSTLNAHEFGELVFSEGFYKEDFTDVVPRDSAYDCICNFVDFRQDTACPMPYKRNIASIHCVDDAEFVKIEVSVGYIVSN